MKRILGLIVPLLIVALFITAPAIVVSTTHDSGTAPAIVVSTTDGPRIEVSTTNGFRIEVSVKPVVAEAGITNSIPVGTAADLFGGLMNSATDTFKAALYNGSATLDYTVGQYTTSGEVHWGGYSAGGIGLTNAVVSVSGKNACLSFDKIYATGFSGVTGDESVGFMIYDSSTTNTKCTALHAPFYCCSGSGTGNCPNMTVVNDSTASTLPTNGGWWNAVAPSGGSAITNAVCSVVP